MVLAWRRMAPGAAEASFAVGDRVAGLDGARATVRFAGAVAGTEGEWLGVEWDDAARGKHGGEHEGVRYFEVDGAREGAEHCASFVRARKLQPPRTFSQALRDKYASEEELDADVTGGPAMSVQTTSGATIGVELVGEGALRSEQGQLACLSRVFLEGAPVSGPGPTGEAGALAPALEEIDVSGALLCNWSAAAALVAEFPKLRALHLNRARLGSAVGDADALAPFAKLSVLSLNACALCWADAVALGRAIPALKELHLSANGIKALESDGGGAADASDAFRCLTLLNLDDNALADWAQLAAVVGGAPALERLQLSANAIAAVSYPGAGSADGEFSALKTLILGGNKLDAWESVDALARFPALEELRLSGNPLFGGSGSAVSTLNARLGVIARMASLRHLNGSEVRPTERRDAELRYLRELPATSGKAPEEIAAENDRYRVLLAWHGPQMAASGDGSGAGGAGGSLGESMLHVTIDCVAARAAKAGGAEPKQKKLPGSMTVGKLRLLCERLTRVPAARQRLFVRERGAPLPDPLDDDSLEIALAGVREGATIIVDEEE